MLGGLWEGLILTAHTGACVRLGTAACNEAQGQVVPWEVWGVPRGKKASVTS